jgi:ABC-2 type transport system permease protein
MSDLRQRLLLPTFTLWQREVIRFYRQRSRIVGALATPVLFWVLLGAGFSASFRPAGAPPEMSYGEYFFPGAIVLIVLFTAIFSTISVIEDRREGFLQAVLVAPVSRAAVVLGKILGGTTLALGQALLLLLAAPLLGLKLGPGDLALVTVVLFAIAFGLTTLGFLIAWKMESTQGFHAIMNLVLMPMWFLSGAFFPASGAPGWMRVLMAVDPLTYGLAALRHALYPRVVSVGAEVPALALSIAVTCAFAVVAFLAARALVARPLDVSLAS